MKSGTLCAPWATQTERGNRTLVRAAMWCTLRAGWPIGRMLLVPITIWFLVTSARARAASRDYLTRALGRPAGLRDVARHFFTFASAVLDRVFLLTGRQRDFQIQTEGLEHVTAILDSGRGCILLGAHLGSFEVLRSIAQTSPVPVWALMFRRNAGALTAILDRLAPDLQDCILDIGDTDSMIRAHECVARGEIVGILADRSPSGHRQVHAPFLGSPAAFPAGPFILASTLAAPVVLFHGVRTGPRRYAVRFERFADRVVLRRASRNADLQSHVAQYAAALERACRNHPYNWFNFFPFWGSADADAPNPSATPDRPSRRRAGA
ncbi:MAG: lipid A biosynthesis acyltransferase [Gemmatimonadaceae bacterium]|nr:lipid A biosynthesis acyltransferase [Acetobacteraceae bacterium]